ncbi:DUF2971 domain-containing protein [Mesorhizobium sp. M6A.T.Ca.TU.002.02.2.1]|nr:DUF2971 domain-containing protein [Mesorhizobium sp. M6A.T.Ca.TU.002.02.2.1]
MADKTASFKMPRLEALDPVKSPVIFHYCSLEIFLSIVQYKSLRLSDINTMNDYSELHWAYDRFIEAVNQVRAEYEDSYFDYLDKLISTAQLNTLPLLSCFSTDGDVLSQWRAYADDGMGVAVGFDSAIMETLAIRCAPVTYDPALQVEFFRDLIAAAFPMWKLAKDARENRDLAEFLTRTTFDMCLMKNPAFAEEKEVRIARAVVVRHDGDGWHLEDAGGNGSDKISRKKHPIKYRAKSAGLVAHIDLPFSGAGPQFIREVVIGPRSSNNGVEVSMALNANGFKGCKIRTSTATYR